MNIKVPLRTPTLDGHERPWGRPGLEEVIGDTALLVAGARREGLKCGADLIGGIGLGGDGGYNSDIAHRFIMDLRRRMHQSGSQPLRQFKLDV